MRSLTVIGTFVTCVLTLGACNSATAACDPEGDIEFLCGPVNPEDLISVPQSPWVIVSSMEDEGHLYLADTRDHTATVLFPTETSRPQQDATTYGDCSGSPTAQFRPHGLSLRPGNDPHAVRRGSRGAGSGRSVPARYQRYVANRYLDRMRRGTRHGQPQLGCGSP